MMFSGLCVQELFLVLGALCHQNVSVCFCSKSSMFQEFCVPKAGPMSPAISLFRTVFMKLALLSSSLIILECCVTEHECCVTEHECCVTEHYVTDP